MRGHIRKDWFIHPFLKVCVHNFRCTFRKRVCCGHPQLCGRHSTQKASGNFRFGSPLSLSLWKMKHHKLQRLKKVYTNSHLAKLAVVLHVVSVFSDHFCAFNIQLLTSLVLHCATWVILLLLCFTNIGEHGNFFREGAGPLLSSRRGHNFST